MASASASASNIPANLQSVVRDFTVDLSTTFPEYAFLWKKWTTPSLDPRDLEELFVHLTKVFPERFFDILYQNEDIFLKDSEANTQFLPNVEFKILFHCTDITDTTRKAIWKYLQLILMTVLKSVQDKVGFGDAAPLFDGVDETVLQEKMNETLEEIGKFFKNLEKPNDASSESTEPNPETPAFDFEGMQPPNAEELHEHLKGLFDGKIGRLAKEMAEEISKDMESLFADEAGGDNVKSTQDLLKKMMRNPKKMMDLMKNIGGKLETKMKNGEISQEELMKEASELIGKMKGEKGMGDFGEMFKNIAKGMGGGKAKFNTAAFSKMEKQMAAKERMLYKLEEIKEKKASASASASASIVPTDDPTKYVFQVAGAEKPAKSALADKELIDLFDTAPASNPKKKKANKKK